MDPRMLIPFPSEQYRQLHQLPQQPQQHQHQFRTPSAPPSLPSYGYYSLESLERSCNMPPSSIGPSPLPPGIDATTYSLTAHYDPVQHSSMIDPATPLNGGHWARNSGLSSSFGFPQAHMPAYNADPQPAFSAVQLDPSHGWNAESYAAYQQQWAHQTWSHNQSAPNAGGMPALAQKRWFKKPKKIPRAMRISSDKPVPAVEGNPAVHKNKSMERGPGWCYVCEIDCTTDAVLQQHVEGKKHKKQLQRQKGAGEATLQAADNKPSKPAKLADVLEQVWLEVSLMGKGSKASQSVKQDTDSKTDGATTVRLKKKRPRNERETEETVPVNAALLNGSDVGPSNERAGVKEKEQIRCELCNVECNSRAVLEVHFTGKKHAASLKRSLAKA